MAGGFLQSAIICTASGPRLVAFDQDGNPIEGPQPPAAIGDCAICHLLSAGSGTQVPQSIEVPGPHPQVVAVASLADAGVPLPKPLRLTRGQDPPAQA